MIKEYKSNLCKQEDVQNLAWQNQKQLFAIHHEHFIITSNYKIEYKKLIQKLGGLIRLKLLVPISMERGNKFSDSKGINKFSKSQIKFNFD